MADEPLDTFADVVSDALVVDVTREQGIRVRGALRERFHVGWTTEQEEGRLGLLLLQGLTEGAPGRPRRPLVDLDGLMRQLRRLLGPDLTIGKLRTVHAPTMPLSFKTMSFKTMSFKTMSFKTMAAGLPAPDSFKTMSFKTMADGMPMPAPAVLEARERVDVGPQTPGFDARVGVVDTPLFRHPTFDLDRVGADRWFEPFLGETVRVTAGHSTLVTDLVLRQAPGARVMVRGAIGSSGGGGSMWDAAVAMADLVDEGADVLNLSFGCYTSDDEPPLILRRAVERLKDRAVIVASAGNHGAVDGWELGRTRTSPTWPAALEGVVAVGASTGPGGDPAPFTPVAPYVTVLAPGVDVKGAFPTAWVVLPDDDDPSGEQVVPFDGGITWQGSSFAAPVVAGLIASRIKTGTTTAAQAWTSLTTDPDAQLTLVTHPAAEPVT